MVKLSHLPFAPWDMTIKAKGEKQKNRLYACP